MAIKHISEIDITGKVVFIRVDFNVPFDDEGNISDSSRIAAALPTIEYAINKKAKVILASHLGRPKGQVKPEFSLEPVGIALSELLQKDVHFIDDCVGDGVNRLIKTIKDGDVLLLENLRFNPGETENEEVFAKSLGGYADVYINDAFGTMHRAHASTSGMVDCFKEVGIGFLVKRELDKLNRIIKNPDKPFIAVLGGAKVSDKIGVIRNLLSRVDSILIGGAMAYTFLKAKGIKTHNSLVEEQKLVLASTLFKDAGKSNVEILLPIDHLCSTKPDDIDGAKLNDKDIPEGMMGLDIGPKTIQLFKTRIEAAGTIFWNGPMGLFEVEKFSEGTMAMANMIAKSNAYSVVGGGDSVAAINKAGLKMEFDHVSTGGGASLEFLEGKVLPGILALK